MKAFNPLGTELSQNSKELMKGFGMGGSDKLESASSLTGEKSCDELLKGFGNGKRLNSGGISDVLSSVISAAELAISNENERSRVANETFIAGLNTKVTNL